MTLKNGKSQKSLKICEKSEFDFNNFSGSSGF